MKKTPNLDALLPEIAYLQEAEEILSEIWGYLGFTVEIRGLPEETRRKLERHFNFDDSE